MGMKIEEMGYVSEMRQRLGIEKDDISRDADLLAMPPMGRVRLIAGWFHGDGRWADTYKSYFESQGIFLTTNPKADGVMR